MTLRVIIRRQCIQNASRYQKQCPVVGKAAYKQKFIFLSNRADEPIHLDADCLNGLGVVRRQTLRSYRVASGFRLICSLEILQEPQLNNKNKQNFHVLFMLGFFQGHLFIFLSSCLGYSFSLNQVSPYWIICSLIRPIHLPLTFTANYAIFKIS